MPIRPLRPHHPLRDWLVPFALVLLLLSQSMALAHRVVHAPGSAAATVRDGKGLFGEHSATDCRLFDQLAPTDLVPAPVLALSFTFDRSPAAAIPQAVPLTTRLRAFRARDPPSPLA